MKKLYSLLAVCSIAASAFAQSVIFTENMGTATSTTAISANAFQNTTPPIVFSGSADVRGTSNSSTTNYAGASAGANVMINAVDEDFVIGGINTADFTNIQLTFGQRKGSNNANNEMTVEVSENGTTWTALSYTRATGSGTSSWELITPTGNIPSTTNLQIRFKGTNTTEWRIDDVKLTGNSTLAVTESSKNNNKLVKNTNVKEEVIFGAKASDVKIINTVGQVVKNTSVKENETLNVSDLKSGVYIVTGTVNNEVVSQKVIKN